MAWTTTLVTRLRLFIGDTGSTQDYTDSVLQQFIAISAISVGSEVDLGVTFTVDTDVPSISPDPVTDTTVHQGISNLFVIKAACLIARSEVRKDRAKYGLRVKDHLTDYDGREGMKGLLTGADSYCEAYQKAAHEWQIGNRQAGRAILGPYASANYTQFDDMFPLDWGEN